MECTDRASLESPDFKRTNKRTPSPGPSKFRNLNNITNRGQKSPSPAPQSERNSPEEEKLITEDADRDFEKRSCESKTDMNHASPAKNGKFYVNEEQQHRQYARTAARFVAAVLAGAMAEYIRIMHEESRWTKNPISLAQVSVSVTGNELHVYR